MQSSIKFLGFSLLAGCSLFGNAELEPMEISALRLETETKNLPARVQVIDAEKIEQSGSTDLVGLLRKEANLQVRSTSGNSARSSVSMGGFGDNGDGRTLVLLDGHRLNAFDLSPINWYSIPLALVESIEVIRGGQAGTYGNHAVGGVIKINTKLPQSNPTGSIDASAGSFDSYSARGAYSQKIGEIGLTLFGDRVESDGYRVNGGHQTEAGGLRLDWGDESDLRGYLSWAVSDSDFGLPGDLNASALSINRRQTNSRNDRGGAKSSHGRAGLSFEINKNWSFENRLGFEDQERAATMPSEDGYIEETDYKTFSYSPTLHFNSEDRDFLLGFDYFNGRLDKKANFTDSNSDASREYKRNSTALFSSIRNPLSENWDWVANLRFQKAVHELTVSGSELNDMQDIDWASGFGVIRKFDESARFYSSIRRFFRYPSADELVTFGSSSPYPPLNHPSLMPEHGYEVEVGGDWSFEKLLFSGRVFRQWMDREIIWDNGNFKNINIEDTSRLGLDLSTSWSLSDFAKTGLNYQYIRAKIEKGIYQKSSVPLVAEHLIRLFLELSPKDSLYVNIGGSYVGESFTGNDLKNENSKIDDYWLLDLNLNYEFNEKFSVYGCVENLFEKEYLSTAYSTALYPGEGRKVTAGFRYSF
jgi:iron complex outermembrane receptor protein